MEWSDNFGVNGQPFTTQDRDNDNFSNGNCAVTWSGKFTINPVRISD